MKQILSGIVTAAAIFALAPYAYAQTSECPAITKQAKAIHAKMGVNRASVIRTNFNRSVNLDIVDTAVAAGDFMTLVTAVKAAGLVDTLRGDGPFTVFAPTDAAFAKIPKSTLRSLLQPENRAMLAKILTYHVVPGKVTAEDVANLRRAKTVQGGSVHIRANAHGIRINNSRVVKADIETSNGIIHVIDTVLMPQ